MLRVGIAGYGVVGRRRRECLEAHANTQVVAVCDQNFSEAGTVDGVRCFRSYHELLNENLDVLFVCLTNDVAADATIAGLEAGLHVFCEKPPGRNMADISRVIACERKHPKLKLKYGFNHRYHDSVKDAIALISSGQMGRMINMRGIYGKSKIITFNQTDWRTKRSIAGGGVLLDQGIHLVDLMRLFGGEFDYVHSFVSNGHWGFDVEDNAYALMRTKDGVVAQLNSSATQWRHMFNLDMTFEKGSVILSGILSGSKSYGAETLTVVSVDHATDSGDPREQRTLYNRDPSWEEEVADFARAIINNEPVGHGTSKDAYETMRLVYRIYYADPSWRGRYNIPNPDVDLL
jgi:predicted dehydrogenase